MSNILKICTIFTISPNATTKKQMNMQDEGGESLPASKEELLVNQL